MPRAGANMAGKPTNACVSESKRLLQGTIKTDAMGATHVPDEAEAGGKEREASCQRSDGQAKERKTERAMKSTRDRPPKFERKRQRLLLRKQKLEAQAQELLAEAKKAGLRYEAMSKALQGKNDAGRDACHHPTMDDDTDANPAISLQDMGFSTTRVPADEIALKQRREGDGASVRSAFSAASSSNSIASNLTRAANEMQTARASKTKAKKPKSPKVKTSVIRAPGVAHGDMGDAAPATENTSRPARVATPDEDEKDGSPVTTCTGSNRKRKRKLQDEGVERDTVERATRKKVTKQMKSEKEGRGAKPAEEREGESAVKDIEASKAKGVDDKAIAVRESKGKGEVVQKAKKKKAGQTSGEDKVSKETPEGQSQEAERWNISELEGGSARQDKFMRLLGCAKLGMHAPTKSKPTEKAHSKSASSKAQAEIERQFETGIRLKAKGNGQRRGLGAE